MVVRRCGMMASDLLSKFPVRGIFILFPVYEMINPDGLFLFFADAWPRSPQANLLDGGATSDSNQLDIFHFQIALGTR